MTDVVGSTAGDSIAAQRGRARGQCGYMSLEYAMIAPLIFLVIGFVFVLGRVYNVHASFDSGTRDAARAASQAYTYDEAKTAATQIITEAIGDTPTCESSLQVTLTFEDPDPTLHAVEGPDGFAPGDFVSVNSTCQYSVADIGIPGVPGDVTVTSTFTSLIDPNRSLGVTTGGAG